MIESAGSSTDPRPEHHDDTDGPELALLAALREATGVETLCLDDDHDIGLRFGDLPVFVRWVRERGLVCIHSVVLRDAGADPEVLAQLNALNGQGGGIRWYLRDHAVVAVTEIPAVPLVPEHVAHALHGFCATCAWAGKVLRAEFGDGRGVMHRVASRMLH